MRKQIVQWPAILALSTVVVALCCWQASPAFAQQSEIYTATAIASEGVTGEIAGRINIRIVAYTSEEEKSRLVTSFKKDPGDALALLRSMSRGYINIEGQAGRKILAVFARRRSDGGRELILIGEHVASTLEQSRGVKREEHPLSVVHLRFDKDGNPVAGEVFPAVKLAVTEDGYLDVHTDKSNRVLLFEIARQ